MSYNVHFLSADGLCIDSRNYTSNVGGMWQTALELPEKPWLDEHGVQRTCHVYSRTTHEWSYNVPAMNRGMQLLDRAPASETASSLDRAVRRMEQDPDKYRKMEPGNGWGDYEGALDFLRWMLEMCVAYPTATIEVNS